MADSNENKKQSLGEVLSEIGLSEFLQTMERAGVNLQVLERLSDSDMSELKLKVGHRERIKIWRETRNLIGNEKKEIFEKRDINKFKDALPGVKAFGGEKNIGYLQLEQFFFELKSFAPEWGVRVRTALAKLEGQARRWYINQDQNYSEDKEGWELLEKNMRELYDDPNRIENALKELKNLEYHEGDGLEYVLETMELCRKAQIKEDRLMYLLMGLNPEARKYVNLARPTTVDEFRKCLREYENIIKIKRKEKSINNIQDKCDNCGKSGHITQKCWSKKNNNYGGNNKKKPMRCFKCEEEGHPSFKCPYKFIKVGEKEKDIGNIDSTAANNTSINTPTTAYLLGNRENYLGHEPPKKKEEKEISMCYLGGGKFTAKIHIKSNGKEHEALIDSGAGVSAIEEDMIRNTNYEEIEKSNITLKSVNGTTLKYKKRVLIEMEIGGKKYKLPFYVIEGKLSCKIIMGRDCQEIIDYGIYKNALIVDGKQIKWINAIDKDREYAAVIKKTVKIPSNEIIKVSINSPNLSLATEILEFTEKNNECWKQKEGELIFMKGILDKKGAKEIFVINNSDNNLHIKKGTRIGTLRTIDLIEEVEIDYIDYKQKEEKIDGKENSEKLVTINPNLPKEQQDQLEELIAKYSDIFGETLEKKAKFRPMPIDLSTAIPVVFRPTARVPFRWRPFVEEKLETLLKAGVIRPSNSPYSAPLIVVPKAGGKNRLVIDYRGLNKVTIAKHSIIPRIDELFMKLRNKKYMSIADATDGFHQLDVKKEDCEKTAFHCHLGQFEWISAPQGLRNVPRYYNEAMQDMLTSLEAAMSYFDDINVASETFEQHLRDMEDLFLLCRNYNVTLKGSKCFFGYDNLKYLGYNVSGSGIKPDVERVKTIAEYPTPTNTDAANRFLCMIGYYRSFIKDFAKIADPIHECINIGRKTKHFKLTEEGNKAFVKLKDKLAELTLLNHPVIGQDFTLTCDASETGWGCELSQQNKPIAFASGSFIASQRKYGPAERETLGVIRSLEKFKDFLVGGKTKLITDCRALKWLRQSVNSSAKLFRWSLRLSEFDLEIIHKPGKNIPHVDAVSRINGVIEELEETKKLETDKSKICETFHNHSWAGHPGSTVMIENLKDHGFNWPTMDADVKEYVKKCKKCQFGKSSRRKKEGTGSFTPPSKAFERICIDILGPMPVSKGYRYILICVDAHTRWLELLPMKSCEFSTLWGTLMREWVYRFGLPQQILSDNTRILDGNVANAEWERLGVEKITISPYHQASNGLVERYVSTVYGILRTMNTQEWAKDLASVAASIRSRPNMTTGISPYYAVFGERIASPMQQIAKKFGMEEQEMKGKIDWKKFDKQIEERNLLQKKKAKIPITQFTVGDKVLIKNQNMGKLDSRWKGPYQVTEKISNHLYELREENKKKTIRRHIELMKRYNDDGGDEGDGDLKMKDLTLKKDLFEVEEIIDHGEDEDDQMMYLVRWGNPVKRPRGRPSKNGIPPTIPEPSWIYEKDFTMVGMLNKYKKEKKILGS